jgi:alpha-maltose-1-phosphate synthase
MRGLGPLDWGPGISFRPLPGHFASFIHGFPWMFERGILDALLEERPFAIHCHDLSVALIGLAAARCIGCYCVCDFHEWYSENVSWNWDEQRYEAHPRFKSFVYRAGELLVMHRASAVITVCESIANELSSWRYLTRRAVHVVRNIPELPSVPPPPDPPLRDVLGLPKDSFVLLWQGGVGPTRLIEPIIEAVGRVPRVHFVIRGPAIESYGNGYLALASACGAEGRVHCLGPVASERVVAAAAAADAGVWTLPRLSKNFYYALPNKIFEYIAAGLPVLGADFPEACRLIVGRDLGLCFDPYDPGSIATVLARLVEEPGLAERFRANARSTLAMFQSEAEWDKVVAIYRALEAGVRQ